MIKKVFTGICIGFFRYGFLALFFMNFKLFSQEIFVKNQQLTWKNMETIVVNAKEQWRMPVVQKEAIDYDKKIPLFAHQWEIPFNAKIASYSLKNIAYEKIPTNELGDLNLANIPTEQDVYMDAVSSRDKSFAHFRMIPLIKRGSDYMKVTSFDVQYELKPIVSNASQRLSVTNSVLSSGSWYKIAVDTTGVYKIGRSFLSNLGVNVGQINPVNIQIYGNGGNLLPYKIGDFRYDDLEENAIYVSGEDDGHFDTNDYILFYARGPESWQHNNSISSLAHIKNIYSDKAYYFVHIGNESGRRIEQATPILGTPTITWDYFDDYWVYEKDQRNLFQSGQQWLGERFDINNQLEITYTFTNLDVSFPIKVKTRVVAAASNSTQMQVSLNNNSLYNLSISPISGHTLARDVSSIAETTVGSENLTVSLTYNNGGNAGALAFLDYIEIIGKKKLNMGNKQFSFRNFEANANTGIVGYEISNGSNVFQLWDVSNPVLPKFIQNQSLQNTFGFNANGGVVSEYVLVPQNDFYTPTIPQEFRIQNQNLHAINDADYLIITQQDYVMYAEELAQYHRTVNGLNVHVVPLYQIYNEFASGATDITGIRDFVKHVYDQSNMRLKYVLMYGDASFDFKGIQYDQGVVPAFQSFNSFDMTSSFVTDDFFGIVSDSDEGFLDSYSSQSQDVAVSRIPFRNAREAQEINQKILNYYGDNSFGDWRNEILMIADDTDAASDEVLQISQEALTDDISANKQSVNIKKMWIDAYIQEVAAGGQRYPQVNSDINNFTERGVLMVDYFGHGGEDGLALERIIETQQIENWNNFNTLNLFTVISCEFARYDNPLRPDTAGELVIRNPQGGAAHMIATTREVFITTGDYFNHQLMPKLLEFNGEINSISENLRQVKNTNNSNQRYFIYSFGDPAMSLAIPKPDIRLTHMNGVPITQSLDTINALSHISFDGLVTNASGTLDANFNGEMYLSVFDKPMERQTLNNDGISQIMTFDIQDSKLFRGRASVENGLFHIEFIAPQDLRIAYGYGKLSFYAHNFDIDKNGYKNDIVIGGINTDAIADNEGPEIRLYMNDTSFIDGGNTNQSPLFIAKLEDENGINTSFSSVDHDIAAFLDDDQQNPIILNDYYITELDDYTKGGLEYRLRDLEVGPHTIKLRAYDTYNNPSEATLNFVVVDDAALILEHVLNYPNPFVNYTEFWFSHNKPNEPLEVQVQVFTISGKLVKTLNQQILNSGSLSRDIIWNGLDDFGQKIGKGVYVFKLSVHATNSNLKAEKFEKLVILQ